MTFDSSVIFCIFSSAFSVTFTPERRIIFGSDLPPLSKFIFSFSKREELRRGGYLPNKGVRVCATQGGGSVFLNFHGTGSEIHETL